MWKSEAERWVKEVLGDGRRFGQWVRGGMAGGWVSKDMTGGSMEGVASKACGGQSVGV